MAGSYNHVVDHRKDGGLYAPKTLLEQLDTRSGDVYECVEEMYGMIWYLAAALAEAPYVYAAFEPDQISEKVEEARQNYKEGLKLSPTKRFKEN